MSRGKNSTAVRRGNKTLAWYISDKILDKNDPERDTPSPILRAQSVTDRKNSLESQSSLASGKTGGNAPSEHGEEKRRRNRRNDRRAHKKQTNAANTVLLPHQPHDEEPRQDTPSEDKAAKKEDYWYYDPVSDGFYYEHNGSRGWRKRNPKLHGPPVQMQKPEPQEQKMIPLPPAVLTSKFFPSATAPNVPNIKYYDAATDGYFYEMASVDGWRRRQPVAPASAPNTGGFVLPQQHPPPNVPQSILGQKFGGQDKSPSSLPNSFMQPKSDRVLTNAEVEDMIVSNAHRASESSGFSGIFGQKPTTPVISGMNNNQTATTMLFSSMLNQQQQQKSRLSAFMDEYPSSSSTVSSSMSDDHATPPPQPTKPLKESEQQPVTFDLGSYQTTNNVGSFEEPYEFYWSDTEKTSSTIGKTSSVSSVDDYASPKPQDTPLSSFNELRSGHNRPNSLSLANQRPSQLPPLYSRNSAYVPGFNVDQFIADLPPMVDHEKILSNLSATRTPLCDTNAPQDLAHDSPLFTPVLLRENIWDRLSASRNTAAAQHNADAYDSATASLEQGLRDIEKLWQSAF